MALAETENSGDPEFSWGKKRGVGGKKKEVQFYESFTYDGMEYTLYDCVYMQNKDMEAEPYIGKLVKIWENADKSKRIKVQWFFRPSEISYWLEKHNVKASENELFFASGDGPGLANVNHLEAIAGKCLVVCISSDCRNLQPSEEQLQMADYVFHRCFDVGQCNVLDKMDDKVGGLEVRFVFNRQENGIDTGPTLGSNLKEHDSRIAVACEEIIQDSGKKQHEVLESIKEDGNRNHLVPKEDTEATYLLPKDETAKGRAEDFLDHLVPTAGKTPAHLVDQSSGEVAMSNGLKNNYVDIDAATNQFKDSTLPDNQGIVRERLELDPSNFDNRSLKRANLDDVAQLKKSKDRIKVEQSTSIQGGLKAYSVVSTKEKRKPEPGKETVGVDGEMKFTRDSNSLGDRLLKKLKVCESAEDNLEKENTTASGSKAKGSFMAGSSVEDAGKAKLAQSSAGTEKDTKFTEDSKALDGKPSNKLKVQESAKLSEDKNKNNLEKANITTSGIKAKGSLLAGSSAEGTGKTKLAKNYTRPGKDVKFTEDSKALDDKPTKKLKIQELVKLSEDKNMNNFEKANITTEKANITTSGSKAKGCLVAGSSVDSTRKDSLVKYSAGVDDGPSKEKPNSKLSDLNKNWPGPEKIHTEEEPEEKMRKLTKSSSKIDKGPSEMRELKLGERANYSHGLDKGPSKGKANEKTNAFIKNYLGLAKGPLEEKLDEKIRMLPNNSSTKTSHGSVDVNYKNYGKIFEVTQRRDAEKAKWFKPSDDWMVDALAQRRLVLLQNLDPEYTSWEVEDIFLEAFGQRCTAKVVQRTAFSSRFNGQALVIFRSREVAELIVGELNDGCLLLSNQRPLIGSIANLPQSQGNQCTFHGHLSIDENDKRKNQMQREKKDAASTSHCSQQNTIEYEFAMEWCLLQSRSDFSWLSLHEAQGEEYKKLVVEFTSNSMRKAP